MLLNKEKNFLRMSLKEILDDALYKIGGGVTDLVVNKEFKRLRRYIFDYSGTHWHRNKNGKIRKITYRIY